MEFALVSPLLIILVFGIIQFGIIFAQQLSLSNGARQGARVGVVNKTVCGDIVSQVQQSADTLGMDPTKISVQVQLKTSSATTTSCAYTTSTSTSGAGATQPCLGSTSSDRLIITAKFTSSLVIPLATSINALDLVGKGVYRCEYTN